MSTTDSWTCPTCGATWNRMDQTREQWEIALRRVQIAHGRDCRKTRGTR